MNPPGSSCRSSLVSKVIMPGLLDQVEPERHQHAPRGGTSAAASDQRRCRPPGTRRWTLSASSGARLDGRDRSRPRVVTGRPDRPWSRTPRDWQAAMDPSFEDVWRRADTVPGWLKRGQAALLWDEALALPAAATVLEIGSHQGRSTVVLGERCGDRRAGDRRGPVRRGQALRRAVDPGQARGHLAENDLTVWWSRPDYSTRLRPTWRRPIQLLYIDGKHDYWTFSDDLRWSRLLPAGVASSCTTASPRSG